MSACALSTVGADERVRLVDAAGHHDVVLAVAVVAAGDEAVVVVAHAPLGAVGGMTATAASCRRCPSSSAATDSSARDAESREY